MTEEYDENDGTLSVLVVGIILLGIVAAIPPLFLMKFETDLISFDTKMYDCVIIAFSVALMISGLIAFKNNLVPEALLMTIFGFNNLGFALGEFLGGDATTMGAFDAILFVVLICSAIMIWIGGDRILAAIAAVISINCIGFLIGSSAGNWICIITGIMVFAMCLVCAMNYWRIMIDIDYSQDDSE